MSSSGSARSKRLLEKTAHAIEEAAFVGAGYCPNPSRLRTRRSKGIELYGTVRGGALCVAVAFDTHNVLEKTLASTCAGTVRELCGGCVASLIQSIHPASRSTRACACVHVCIPSRRERPSHRCESRSVPYSVVVISSSSSLKQPSPSSETLQRDPPALSLVCMLTLVASHVGGVLAVSRRGGLRRRSQRDRQSNRHDDAQSRRQRRRRADQDRRHHHRHHHHHHRYLAATNLKAQCTPGKSTAESTHKAPTLLHRPEHRSALKNAMALFDYSVLPCYRSAMQRYCAGFE